MPAVPSPGWVGDEVYLEKPALLHKLAEQKFDVIRKELDSEGWAWIEINPERDWEFVHRCGRIQPRLVDAPAELVDLKRQLDAELEEVEQALEDDESDALMEQQEAIRDRLSRVEEKLAAFVGFDEGHKMLAGCYVSIGQDGTPFIDKGLVKPEHRKALAKLLGSETANGEPAPAKPKNALPLSLLRELADYRLQIAQVEMAKHPEIALDLITFTAASRLLGDQDVPDGPDVEFTRTRIKLGDAGEGTVAAQAMATIEQALETAWLKKPSEAERFEAFRLLPQAAKLELLAYCVALTLRPVLAPASDEETSAYDAALSLTEANVAAYWRPAKASHLSRVNRQQLLLLARDTLGETWALSSLSQKKALLVDQIDRAFADPDRYGRTPDQQQALKNWLPAGMDFHIAPAPKPAKAKKARKAA